MNRLYSVYVQSQDDTDPVYLVNDFSLDQALEYFNKLVAFRRKRSYEIERSLDPCSGLPRAWCTHFHNQKEEIRYSIKETA